MKKLLAVLLSMVLVFAMSAVAFANAADELLHNGSLPATSEQAVKITIRGLTDGSGPDPDTRLPSEYHVRVIWTIQDGVYSATATDADDDNGFKNFSWDCETLDFKVNSVSSTATEDVRVGNWKGNVPKVAFEVTNASTPDLPIYVAASLKDSDTWAAFMKDNFISAQNTAIGTKTVSPVLKANLGTGVKSYEQNLGSASHNVYAYEYTLNWDYDKLNQKALDLYKAGTASSDFTNTFVVTVSANAPTTMAAD